MARQNSDNLVAHLRKLLDDEQAHVGRAKLTLSESRDPREGSASPASENRTIN